MLRVAIVGAGADKFTLQTRTMAQRLIEDLLFPRDGGDEWPVLVSGHSPVGGVDIWAEECARLLAAQRGVPDASIIHAPRTFSWEGDFGFRERNLAIVRDGDETHVVVVRDYPPDYRGRRFDGCYHCRALRPPHVKSGGCWTGIQAQRSGKPATWHILSWP